MIYELLELSRVLEAVQTTGTEVRYYDERCNQDVAGFYRLGPNVDRLVICPRNHINHSDLFDTIRHEAIHVVQACNGWDTVLPVSDYTDEVTSEMAKTLADYPQDTKTQSLETEAYVLSAHLSEQQVINLINKYCFE